jgi:hypothetical protein
MRYMPPLIEPLECPLDDVAHVPRRFGVGVMLILMTAFAVLFAVMRTFRAPPEVFVVTAGLFFAVTLAQIVLFQGKKPRAASLLAGGIVFPLEMAAVMLWEGARRDFPGDFVCELLGTLIGTACIGAPLGYVAGCIMAGVFFVQERLSQRKAPAVELSLVPLTEADFDTLCTWLRHRPLFELWSQEQFRYPLDQEQLEDRFDGAMPAVPEASSTGTAATASPPPEPPPQDKPGDETALLQFLKQPEKLERLVFKAVTGEIQVMAAAIELSNIDRNRSRANIELAIVDPTRNDRGRISGTLVRAIVEEAFHRQRLHWLRVVLPRKAEESIHCFRMQEFYELESAAMPSSEYALLVRGRRYT